MSVQATDRIQKEILLRAPRSRVWRALVTPSEFGDWFKVDLTGVQFVAGRPVQGKMTYPGYEGMPFEMVIDKIEPEQLFSYRWHPYAIDTSADYSAEPMTLVEFRLEEIDSGGTRLRVTESGFDQIPLARRAEAFRMNTGGWEMQLQNIEAYLARGA